jgi:hypothetical protein
MLHVNTQPEHQLTGSTHADVVGVAGWHDSAHALEKPNLDHRIGGGIADGIGAQSVAGGGTVEDLLLTPRADSHCDSMQQDAVGELLSYAVDLHDSCDHLSSLIHRALCCTTGYIAAAGYQTSAQKCRSSPWDVWWFLPQG